MATTRLEVGGIHCLIVRHAEAGGPPSYLFPETPESELAEGCAPHMSPDGNLGFVYSSLVLRRGDLTLVIDTGPDPSSSNDDLDAALSSIGSATDEVEHVVLSHAHADHVGGLTFDENGEYLPRFPAARHHLLAAEWSYWMKSDDAGDMAQQTRTHLHPVGEANLVEMHDDENEIMPGVVLLPTPGHTPGHASVVVRDRGETLVYLGDVVTHQVMVEQPEWHSVFDVIPALAVKTRRRMIRQAEEAGAVVVASHVPVPGRITRNGQGRHRFLEL